MPAPYGVTATGFSVKTAEEILADVNAYQKAQIHNNWDVSTGSPLGQVNGIMSDELASLWEAVQASYDSRDPDNASDQSLAQLSLVSGTLKKGAQKATLTCTCNLDADTYAAGALIAHVTGDPDARFVNKDIIVSPGGNVTNLTFEAETAGPFEAATGAATIAQPVTGWNSVTITTAATGGAAVESDPALRLRREQELAGGGSTTIDAIAAAVSAVTGVISVTGLENKTKSVDANGLEPNSFEVVIWDGASPAADDDAIAQAIWDNHPGGIDSNGSSSGTAVDKAGNNQTVKFSRVTTKRVYLEVDVTAGSGYVGDAAVATALEDYGDATYKPDLDVIEAKLTAVVAVLAGVDDVTEIRLGFSASPTGTANLTIGVREVATIDDADVTVSS